VSARRPIFRDGERLTAQRLNEAFGFVDDGVRRAQLGTVGAGVSSGYQLSADAAGPAVMLRIEPGLAIDGAGRFLVTAGPQLVSINEIEDQTGPLAVGARVAIKVHARTPAMSSTDPCATARPQVVEDRPIFAFATIATASLTTAASARATMTTVMASAMLPAWSDLSGGAGRDLAVTLGSITILSDSGGFSVSMAERQGVAPRGDAFFNSFGQQVMTLRSAAGEPEVRFLARTSGADLTASRIGASSGSTAAGVAPSDPRVLVVHNVSSIPIELDPEGGPVDAAGIPIEMARAPAGSTAVRARRAGKRPSHLALGVSAAAAYTVDKTLVVPLATAGLVEVRVRSGDAGVPLGAPLQLAGDSDLAVVTGGTAVVVARAAQQSDQRGGVVTLLAWVNPAQLVTLGPSPDRPRID
jgi:hypothetical protein